MNQRINKIILPTPFAVGDVNVYVIKGDRLTLVDTGPKTKEAWESFQFQLKEMGYSPRDIEQVVLTHHHPDHVGLLDFLDDDVDVLAHKDNARWLKLTDSFLQEHEYFYKELFHSFGVPTKLLSSIDDFKKSLDFSCNRFITKMLAEHDEVEGLLGWKVLETPGHAQGHIVLFHELTGIMIGGDHILATISSNPLLEPPLPGMVERPKPLLQYNDSLRKVAEYPVQLIHAGHGPNVRHVHSLIERRLERQKTRAQGVKDLLNEHPLTVFEINQRLFPAVYEKQLELTLSETVGQLDYLLEQGEIAVEKNENHVLHFYVRS